jgi:hypothetical protein
VAPLIFLRLPFRPAYRRITDAQIQLISGHENKKSLDLEVYQHLSLESVDKAYQVKDLPDLLDQLGIR